MAAPIFTLNLNHKILPGHVTIGKYDGTHSCLTATTSADQVYKLRKKYASDYHTTL